LAQLNLLDSHDTPRFITSVNRDGSALRLSYLFLFTYPGAPCLYYGDEIGMEGASDPDCRRSFPWDQSSWDHDLREYVKKCIALRKVHPALRRGSYHRLVAHDNVYVFGRWLDQEKIVIAFNASSRTHTIDVPVDAMRIQDGVLTDVWNADARWLVTNSVARDLKLAPRTGAVLMWSGT
jgi:neopullulanase